MYIHLSLELDVTPSGDLNLLVDDLPVTIRVLDDGVMEKEENVTLTLTEVNFNQEQGKYFINTLNIIIAADECESSGVHICTYLYSEVHWQDIPV